MAVERDNPYGAFNFLVDIGTGDNSSIKAGFQDVSGLSIDVTMMEYRNGNEKVNHVRKVSGLYKVSDITLKRGLMGSTDLYLWMKAVREGDQTEKSVRSVTIQLQDEAHQNTVMTWKIKGARPMKYSGPAFSAKASSEVAIEELVLSIQDMEIE